MSVWSCTCGAFQRVPGILGKHQRTLTRELSPSHRHHVPVTWMRLESRRSRLLRLAANICGTAAAAAAAAERVDSHVSVGVDAAVFLHVLHLCWVNMLDLLDALRLHTGNGRRFIHGACSGGNNGKSWEYLRLDRHLLGGASRLDRHTGLKRDCGGGVSARFGGLHGA